MGCTGSNKWCLAETSAGSERPTDRPSHPPSLQKPQPATSDATNGGNCCGSCIFMVPNLHSMMHAVWIWYSPVGSRVKDIGRQKDRKEKNCSLQVLYIYIYIQTGVHRCYYEIPTRGSLPFRVRRYENRSIF